MTRSQAWALIFTQVSPSLIKSVFDGYNTLADICQKCTYCVMRPFKSSKNLIKILQKDKDRLSPPLCKKQFTRKKEGKNRQRLLVCKTQIGDYYTKKPLLENCFFCQPDHTELKCFVTDDKKESYTNKRIHETGGVMRWISSGENPPRVSAIREPFQN